MRIRTTIATGLAGLATAGVMSVPALASTTGDVYFVNGNDNPTSFKCYRYVSSTWKVINAASGATITHTTRIKCNSAWRGRVLGGSTLPGQIGANQVTSFQGVDAGVYNTISAKKV